jgi:predicted TIM-barrel fold metal-dependent hydrolase
MNKFFDVNYWINGSRFTKDGNKEIKKLNNSLIKNNINSVIVTNKLALSYDWNIGNNELLASKTLSGSDNVYFSFVLVPDAYFTMDFEKYIKSCLNSKVRLFRLFPKSQLFNVNDYYMKKIFKVLSYYRIPLMIDLKQLDITGNKYFAINDLKNILSENKELPIIFECSLKQLMFARFFYPFLEEYQNFYIEISNLFLIDQIENIVERFGSKRLIFGTNYPNLEIEFSVNRILMSDLDSTAKENIAYSNIDSILRSIKIG